MDRIHNPSTKLPPLRPRMQSKIPTAPIAKQRRFSWTAKKICCRPPTIQEDSRIPSAPVPHVKMHQPVRDGMDVKAKPLKFTQHHQPTFQRTGESKLRRFPEDPVNRTGVVANKTSARRSTIMMTTQSSAGCETPSRIPSPGQRAPDAKSLRKERRSSTRDGDSSVGSQSRRAPQTKSSSERTKPQIALQTPGATTWKPMVARNSEAKSHNSRSLSHRRRESAPSAAKDSEKPKEEKKSRSFSGVLRKTGSNKSDQHEKPSLKADQKSEMTLWKRFRNQISSKTIRRATKSDEDVIEPRKTPSKKKLSGQCAALPSRRKSFPTGVTLTPTKDTDGESICTGQPLFAKADPDTLSSPMTPRSLAFTNVNDNADQSARREIRVLQRCTTLTPEPNPRNVFQTFQGFPEFRGSEIQEEKLYTDGRSSAADDAESKKQSIFSPLNLQNLNQKDSTYSSVSADLLHSQSSGSPSFCLEETKSRGSPRKVFSNPLLSVSPEPQSSSSSFKLPAPIRVQKLRIPNMPSNHSSQDSMGTPGCPTLRRMDCSQIEAQCELIRETLKEESKRLMTMTTMLEGLTPRPATAAGIDSVSNQDLDRRYIEKINDLQLENRHLRQLLEFSIGSMRKQTWVPTPVPTTPCYGNSFNNPIASFDQVDTGAAHDEHPQPRIRRTSTDGKRLRNDPEYIAQVTESLDNKDKLLKVVIESAAQITSLQRWYAKRLDELERDRKRLQAERDDCVKELDRCTACSPDLMPSKACCQVTPRVRSFNMVFRA